MCEDPKRTVDSLLIDFHAGVIQDQMERPEFAELIEHGVLDAAVLDLNAVDPYPIRLLSSGRL